MDTVKDAVDGGQHQSIARINLLLETLAAEPEQGMKLAEICRATGLGKATAHRLLTGLVAYRLVDSDPASGRYFVGFKIFSWACGVGNRFGLVELARPSLEKLAERFQDVVYLLVRNGDETVCVERVEGSYPIKTLALDVGGRRPLGVGAGGAAIAGALPENERQALIRRGAAERRRFGCDEAVVVASIETAAHQGFSVVDGAIVPNICTVGVAITLASGDPIAAVSVSALTERMTEPRRREVAAAIRAEIDAIRTSASRFLIDANRSRLLAGLTR
jgi:DNA-binding IclR family transcriptional regulator